MGQFTNIRSTSPIPLFRPLRAFNVYRDHKGVGLGVQLFIPAKCCLNYQRRTALQGLYSV